MSPSPTDGELRRRLSHEVRDILKARGTSAILVTHDQEEAFAVSDHVGVFKEGRLEQWDTPYNLYHEPRTPFVASFIGQGYFIRGQMMDPQSVHTELGVLRGNRAYPGVSGAAVDVLLRPDDIVYAPHSDLKARVIGRTFQGASTLYRLQLSTGSQLEAIFPAMPTTARVRKSVFVWQQSIWCCSRRPVAWPCIRSIAEARIIPCRSGQTWPGYVQPAPLAKARPQAPPPGTDVNAVKALRSFVDKGAQALLLAQRTDAPNR